MEQFQFTEKHSKTFIGLSLLGLVLLIGGMLLSYVQLPEDPHGHGGGEEHASLALASAETGSAGAVSLTAEGGHGGGHGEVSKVPSFMARLGAVFLVGNVFFLLLSAFGPWFIAVNYLSRSAWYVTVKRIYEAYYKYLPIVAVFALIFFFGFKNEVYEWANWDESTFAHDPVAKLKSAFLNPTFGVLAMVILPLIAFMGGMYYRKNSLAEDALSDSSDISIHDKTVTMSALFMPFFMLAFLFTCWQWVMSVDPKWYSTMFWVYMLADMIVISSIVTALIVIYLKEAGYLKHVSDEHLHDLGKWMFAFSIFWAYIWVSQYLLIWYANIPEETIYYYNRFEMGYNFLFWLNVLINFLFPFLALMTRKSKRVSLKQIGMIMLFGRFLDIWLLVVPGVLGEHGGFSILIAGMGMILLQGGIWLFVVFKELAAAPLLPKNHPYLDESVHHDVGI